MAAQNSEQIDLVNGLKLIIVLFARYVNCKDLSAASAAVVRSGELKIVPATFESEWFKWMDNCRDWCISRQLWWGHRVPAYRVHLKSDQHAGRPLLCHFTDDRENHNSF